MPGIYDEPFADHSPIELGEEFYNNVTDSSFNPFWDNVLSQWIDPSNSWWNMNTDPGNTNYTEGWSNREEWWNEYGSMFNLDIEGGLNALDREGRIRDMSKDQLTDQFSSTRFQSTSSVGKTGFAGSGAYQNTLDDLWSKYVGSTTALNLQYENAQNEIYEDQGESIYDTLEGIAEQGGLDWEEEPGTGHCNCYGGGTIVGDQCMNILNGQPMGPLCT